MSASLLLGDLKLDIYRRPGSGQVETDRLPDLSLLFRGRTVTGGRCRRPAGPCKLATAGFGAVPLLHFAAAQPSPSPGRCARFACPLIRTTRMHDDRTTPPAGSWCLRVAYASDCAWCCCIFCCTDLILKCSDGRFTACETADAASLTV